MLMRAEKVPCMRRKDFVMTTSSSGAPSLAGLSGTIVLVGVGKMGGALLEGWLALGLDPKSVIAIEPQPTPELTALTKRGLRLNPSASDAGSAAAVVIALKPQVAPSAMMSLKCHVGSDTLVLSIMAGSTLAFLEREFMVNAIVRARLLSRATVRNIWHNLGFAFGYNALGIPIAAGVLYPATGLLLSPLIAALAMSFSSVSVISNSLRLRRT